jgi:hypothetical protein
MRAINKQLKFLSEAEISALYKIGHLRWQLKEEVQNFTYG